MRDINIYLSIPNPSPNSQDKFGSWAERDFPPALRKLNHTFSSFNWYLPSMKGYESWLKKNKRRKNSELLRDVEKKNNHKKIDLYLGTIDGRYIYPETVEKIKKLGITTMNYQCDDDTAFYLNEEVAPYYDYNWTTQPGSFKNYKKIGANFIYTSFGSNPEIYKPYQMKPSFDVTFVGRNMGYRDEFIQHISLEKQYKTKVWGIGWPTSFKDIMMIFGKRFYYSPKYFKKHFKVIQWYLFNYKKLNKIFQGVISYNELIKMYSKSKISLNFSGGVGKEMYNQQHAFKSNKLRDIEATMSGAFYLTEYTEKIKNVFKIGKEIECFKDKNELHTKIKYYLDNPDEREAIRENGMNKSLESYTWERIFQDLFDKITLK